MPPRPLPARPNLEQLKKQAKELLKAYRAGHSQALVRFRESLSRLSGALDDDLARPPQSLRDAQRVVAMEYGFASWSHMQTHIEQRESIDMLEVTVDRVMANPSTHQRVVVLKGKEVSKYLPIWVGLAEGVSIALKLQGKEMPRPMTHDLMDSMIGDLGAKVVRVVVSELKGDTFLAKVILQRNGTTVERDSRPSDAIALAVRTGASIYVEEDVLDRAGVSFDPEEGNQFQPRLTRPVEMLDDRFLEEAKGLLSRARVQARRLGHDETEPADILVALIDDPEGAGARVAAELGLDLAEARSKLEEKGEHGDWASVESPDLSEASQRVLRLAGTEAFMLFGGQVGAEHILLGLLLADDGVASQVLKESGIEIESARAAVTRLLSEDAETAE